MPKAHRPGIHTVYAVYMKNEPTASWLFQSKINMEPLKSIITLDILRNH